tara:strand:+ start:63 stop:767 length:705 start_codon:yes stop_codon:yes gene_type:complete
MQQYLQNQDGLVENVFNKVFDKYDIMNDFMSFGIHRVWKKNLLTWMNPSSNKILVDVACGTGDIGKLFLDFTNKDNEIFCIDPNIGMIKKGKNKLKNYKNIKWIVNSAEKLSLKENSCDYYTISFGLRNTKSLNKTLSEAYRILKPGGRFLCLEFSKIQNSNLKFFYKNYSKIIPYIGSAIVGEKEPYEYLNKSINEFINQEQLIELMKQNNFQNCSYRNLTGGIVAIHSGWKI